MLNSLSILYIFCASMGPDVISNLIRICKQFKNDLANKVFKNF